MNSEEKIFFTLADGNIDIKHNKNIKPINRWKSSRESGDITIKPKTGTVKIKECGEYKIDYNVSYKITGSPTELTIKDILPSFSGEFVGSSGISSDNPFGFSPFPGGSLIFNGSEYKVISGLGILTMNGDIGFGYFNSVIENPETKNTYIVTASFDANTFVKEEVVDRFVHILLVTVTIDFNGLLSEFKNGYSVSGTGVLKIYITDYSATVIPEYVMNLPVRLPFNHVRTYNPSITLVKNNSSVLSEAPLASAIIPKAEILKSLLNSIELSIINTIGTNLNSIASQEIYTILPVPKNAHIPTLHGILDSGEVSFSNIYKLEPPDKLKLFCNQTPPCNSIVSLSSPLDLETTTKGTTFNGFKLN